MDDDNTHKTVVLKSRNNILPIVDNSSSDLMIKVGMGEKAEIKTVHRMVLARISSLLRDLLINLDEEDVCILVPEISASTINFVLKLAYNGYIGGLTTTNIRQVREACQVLSIRQEEFVVRVEENKIIDELATKDEFEKKSFESYDSNKGMIGMGQSCFQCELCAKTFIYAKSYERHVENCNFGAERNKLRRKTKDKSEKEVENDTNIAVPSFKFQHYLTKDDLYYCTFPGCTYKEAFKTAGGCKNHQLRHHATEEEKIYLCKYCNSKFASNQLRNKHENLMHNKRFSCDVCNKVFSEKTRLMIHFRIHSGEKPFVCESCGFSCSQRDNLRLHKEFKHPSEGQQDKKFTCQICDASFLTKSNLSRHKMSHSDQKSYVCETCGKAFKDPGALKQHNFSHGAPDYGCTLCDQKFTSPLYLNRHMLRIHPTDGVQPITCGTCGKGFPLKHQLEEHIQSVHQNVKHCCPHCNIPIGRRSSVARHIKKGRCKVVSSNLEIPDDPSSLSYIAIPHMMNQ